MRNGMRLRFAPSKSAIESRARPISRTPGGRIQGESFPHLAVGSREIRSEGVTLWSLTAEQEGLWVRSSAADLERPEILVPVRTRYFWLCLDPESEPIQIRDADRSVTHAINQMLTNASREIAPALDFWHQLPKTIRPNCSPSRFTSSGSVAFRKRSARSKNSFCFSASA